VLPGAERVRAIKVRCDTPADPPSPLLSISVGTSASWQRDGQGQEVIDKQTSAPETLQVN